jgi:hypothetical protein
MNKRLPGSYIATGHIPNATTAYHAESLSLLFGFCEGAMKFNNRVFIYGDRLIRVNLNWIRDYVLSMKGFRYTEKELRSFPDLLLEKQHPKGFFYEIIAPITDMHSGRPWLKDGRSIQISAPECCYYEEGMAFGLCRLELEADVEYLMVEGAEMIWQASGDEQWLAQAMPKLEKGLGYICSDPLRWDSHYQLAKRPRTLDTWDFLDNPRSSFERAIHADDPMGIFHGDNTGLYNARIIMARLHRALGNDSAACRHEELAAALRERIMSLLWNGDFFRHFLAIDPVDYGVDEERQMSLSNAYALNRNILSFAEKKRVLAAYRAMRSKYGGELDDFRNLEPPYPIFHGRKAGQYVNGAIAPFVAGQLALAAFETGEEVYGVDILKRMARKISSDGKVAFLYDWEGKDIGGGPRCWCGAELMHALCAGLAGVVDKGKLFAEVTLSPRFAAAREPRASVRLEYACSGKAVDYDFAADYQARALRFRLFSSHRRAALRLYLPEGAKAHSVLRNGQPIAWRDELVGQSHYACLDMIAKGDIIDLQY